jgi:hypothetical protein
MVKQPIKQICRSCLLLLASLNMKTTAFIIGLQVTPAPSTEQIK